MNRASSGIRNSFLAGFVPGLAGPWVSALLFWAVGYADMYAFDQWLEIAYQEDILVKLAALGGVVNLGIFYALLQAKWYWSARAVIVATIIYAIVVIVLKLQ